MIVLHEWISRLSLMKRNSISFSVFLFLCIQIWASHLRIITDFISGQKDIFINIKITKGSSWKNLNLVTGSSASWQNITLNIKHKTHKQQGKHTSNNTDTCEYHMNFFH